MQRLDYPEFLARRDAYDAAVAAMPGSELSRFCSASHWILAARGHLAGEEWAGSEGDFIWWDEASGTWLVFGEAARGYWQPFEAAWLFACPAVGPEAEATVNCLEQAARLGDGSTAFAVGGLPEGSGLLDRLRHWGRHRAQGYREFPGIDCLAIELGDGAEAWLARRSRKFRRSLFTAQRRCEEAGLTIESHRGGGDGSDPDRLFSRLMALQQRTAKWAGGSDIFLDRQYRAFYRDLFRDLHRTGSLRLLLASCEGEDAGFIFGGIFGGEYRGLQMSYDETCAHLGLGNWLQWQNLQRCEAEGVALYDLGMEAAYKLRWADRRRVMRLAFIAF
ncbi:MAG: GNAT family N-acetyltransferase [Verrucomicrobiales bacterium]|nr:GNAT family N-acetyltransferase [Verrucomicrobiales bacterium]